MRHGDAREPVELHASWNSEVRVEVSDRGDGFTPRAREAALGRARRLRPVPRRPARGPLGRGDRRRHDRLVRPAAPLTRRCASVQTTSAIGPASWKVTEVADLRGDRLLVVHGELDIATAPELVEMLAPPPPPRATPVVLDLAEVTFMDSTGLTTLMDAHVARRAQRLGVLRSARAVARRSRRVFDLAGVGRLLDE